MGDEWKERDEVSGRGKRGSGNYEMGRVGKGNR